MRRRKSSDLEARGAKQASDRLQYCRVVVDDADTRRRIVQASFPSAPAVRGYTLLQPEDDAQDEGRLAPRPGDHGRATARQRPELEQNERDQPAARRCRQRRGGQREAQRQMLFARSFEVRTSSSHSPSLGLCSASSASGASTYHAPFSTSARSSPGCQTTSPATKRAWSASPLMMRSTVSASTTA